MNNKISNSSYTIHNACIVTPQGMIENGSLRIESGHIAEISKPQKNWQDISSFNAQGNYVLPGFIDIHADSLEGAISPRPSTPFSPQDVLPSYDAELAMYGITTVFHCVGLADLGNLTKPLRKRKTAEEIVIAIHDFSQQSLLKTHIHLRYEISDTESLPLLHQMIDNSSIDLLSIMDHTPGFGVFKDLAAYRDYCLRSGQTVTDADEKYDELYARRTLVNEESLQYLVTRALLHDLTVVSHDDHTAEKLEWARSLGVSVAEFPVTIEAVDYARNYDMATVFGTPNLIRGMSHAGNLLVSDMLLSGRVDILCLDYSPRCSLPALFKAAELTGKSLAEMSKLFSLNPARSVGLENHTGSIETGKAADLIIVSKTRRVPRVIGTFVDGQPVYQSIAEPMRNSRIRSTHQGGDKSNSPTCS